MLPLPIARALLHPYYRLTLHHRMPWRAQRALMNGAARVQPLPSGTTRTAVRLGGRTAELIRADRAAGSAPAGAVLYLHGGGYTVGSPATHRSLAACLARETGRAVYLLDYRLAPEHPLPAALEDTLSAYAALTYAEGHPAASIALAGDSSGGALALAAAQHLLAGEQSQPAALVLVSPWVNPAEVAERSRDMVVNRRWGLACAAAYLGDGDPADPRYVPHTGPLAGLPPTYLHANTRELVYGQCLDLAVSLRRAGVPLVYAESRTLWHAAQTQAGFVREAAASVRDIADFLRANWSGTPLRAADSPPSGTAAPS